MAYRLKFDTYTCQQVFRLHVDTTAQFTNSVRVFIFIKNIFALWHLLHIEIPLLSAPGHINVTKLKINLGRQDLRVPAGYLNIAPENV